MGRDVLLLLLLLNSPITLQRFPQEQKSERKNTHTHTHTERQTDRERESQAQTKNVRLRVYYFFRSDAKKKCRARWVATRPSRELQRILCYLGFYKSEFRPAIF